MSLLRAAARPMLASYFIVSGFKAVRKPDQYVEDAEPVAQRLVPAVQRIAPASISGKIPEDTTTLVRINGALQLGGGLALATGKGRRAGAVMLAVSLVPSTLARHPFWSRDTAEERAEDRAHFLKNVSLLGGVLLASADTEGKPSIAWRAQAGSERLTRKGKRAARKAKRKIGGSDSIVDSVAKTGKDLGESIQPLAGAAIAGGVGLLGEVEKQTRKTRRKAKKTAKKTAKKLASQAKDQAKKAQALAQKQAKKAKKQAPKLAKQAQKQAEIAAKKAKKEAPKLAKQAQKNAKQAQKSAGKQLDSARSSAGSSAKDLASSAKDATKDVRKDAVKSVRSGAHDAKKSAAKFTENIELGSN